MNTEKQPRPVPNIKHLIAVASGKGGVGKSTLAVNLALALEKQGKKAGILDADIYGPSQPWMLGRYESPTMTEDKRMLPVLSHGIPSMSIGYLIEGQDTPMVWRGPMVSQALQQLIYGTVWPALDYLVIDLPPGTGDIQLTLAQKIPVDWVIIITTPQEVAVLDAKKALNMFRKLNVPVLGVVENMTGHVCSACGHKEHIFGEKGGARLATLFNLPLLGEIPLDSRIRAHLDAGLPSLVAEPEGAIAVSYCEIAQKVVAEMEIAEMAKEKREKKTPAQPRKIDLKYEP